MPNMGDSRVQAAGPSQSLSYPPPVGAGIIRSIRVENFMCHDHYVFDLCDWVNFITGQNGSGKSAILTALCIAFGCRAKGTQRASTLKDFIKTGCSYAAVHVEVKNEGEDAFKPEIFGDVVIIERRITASSSSIVLKDHQGKKVATRNKELRELVEHFNIDVENPCVVMSQDNSREFLHSGNDRDKFKFFFRATLLQQVNDLLVSIADRLNSAKESLKELEELIEPVLKEMDELQVKIKSMEHIEVISQQVQQLKKKLAWSWVYDVDRQLKEQSSRIKKLKERIPACQAKIDEQLHRMEKYGELLTEKRTQIGQMLTKTSEVRRTKDELQEKLSMARREKHRLEEEHRSRNQHIQRMVKHARLLEQQLLEIHEHNARNTQAEESEIEGKLNKIQLEIDAANSALTRLKEEEDGLLESLDLGATEVRKIADDIGEYERKLQEIHKNIRQFQQNHTNKVTAFGGDNVIRLLRAIERHQRRFRSPPIGPIGAHLSLADGDMWALAIDHAIGRLLNAFIVTCLDDSRTLRTLANEVNYKRLQILIYDFSRPRLNIPFHMLPQTDHPTILSVLRSENPVVMNVLVDMGSVERQVLVRDYDAGKKVAFEQRVSNLKEVYTVHGHKMFSRGSVETVLPPMRHMRAGRLCSSYDNQIRDLETDATSIQEHVKMSQKRKRVAEEKKEDIQCNLQNVKRRRQNAERDLMSKNLAFRDLKSSYVSETNTSTESTVDELHQEISRVQHEINEKEGMLQVVQTKLQEADAEANGLKLSFEKLCESANVEINALEIAERELTNIEKDAHTAESMKAHYEALRNNTVLPDIDEAHAHYQELENSRKESHEKASTICPENEILALGEWDGSSPEELSAQVKRLNQRLQRESEQYSESLDELKMIYEKKRRKIQRRQQTYEGYREKLEACEKALETRWSKFQRNASFLKRQLTWQFNGHLRKKGISGHIKVNYEERTLSIEVKMPQDSSSSIVRDTRGLSGGERSFSTLCFTLALHEMTEAPFRAMDEFDVFMDAVSRKISLDTLVDFALAQGSQWIFITPHDISMVKEGERIKKLQLAAPRS